MFFRIASRRYRDRTYEYLQLVESYREGGQNKQRVLHTLGNVETLRQDGQLRRLLESLERATGQRREADLSDLTTGRVLEYGAVRVAEALWEQFGMTDLLQRLLRGRRFGFDAVAALATMVFNRLIAPKSELATFDWRDGLWWPDFAAAPLELHHLYAALDALMDIKEPLEEALFGRLKDLFNLQVDVVFYDLTSSYFEGQGPPMASRGYSRDRRPDRPQVILALACERHGFPIAHEVFAGHRLDVTTLPEMIAALQGRFALRHVLFVADSGIVSHANLAALTRAGHEYLVGVRKRRLPDALAHAPEDLSRYQPGPHGVRIYASEAEEPGARYVCCWSESRAEEERQIRQARIDGGRAALQRVRGLVAAGRIKRTDKIAARVATGLRDISEGRLEFRVNEEAVAKERRLEGRYFLLTNAASLSPSEAVEAYFTLQEVERAFREMKDFLRLRPVYHRIDRRVRGHLFVCVLSYLLERSLSHQLRQAGSELSARGALDSVSRIHAVETRIAHQTIWTTSRPPPQAAEVFHAMGMTQLPPVLAGFQPLPDRPASPAGG
jgi:hypothetical protein